MKFIRSILILILFILLPATVFFSTQKLFKHLPELLKKPGNFSEIWKQYNSATFSRGGSVQSEADTATDSGLTYKVALLDTFPDRNQIRLELARVHSYAGSYPDSIKQYYKLSESNQLTNEQLLEFAQVLYWGGQTEEASKIVDRFPGGQEIALLKFRAEVKLANGQLEEARQAYDEILTKTPKDLGILIKLADLLSWQGKFNESLRAFERCIKLDPGNRLLRRRYAQVLSWSGAHVAAAQQYEISLSKVPE